MTIVYNCPPRGEPRSKLTGHRIEVDGQPPKQSRSLPPWTWPGELIGRYLAKRGRCVHLR